MEEKRKYLQIDPRDNVATTIVDMRKGDTFTCQGGDSELIADIAFGHKFALRNIAMGQYIYKYGDKIGRATAAIEKGEHVHVHNVEDIVDEVRKI